MKAYESATTQEDVLFDDDIANAGKIFKRGASVIRPCGPHSATVDMFLLHLRAHGFHGAPKDLYRKRTLTGMSISQIEPVSELFATTT